MKQRKSEINWKLVVRVACLMLLDVMLLYLACLLALLSRFDLSIHTLMRDSGFLPALHAAFPWMAIGMITLFIPLKLYSSLWEFAGVEELLHILCACFLFAAATLLLILFGVLDLPRSFPVLAGLYLVALLSASRFSYRLIRTILHRSGSEKRKKRTMLIGAGSAGMLVLREFQTSENSQKTGCRLKILPGIYQLANGEVNIQKIRNVDVQDLLGRDCVKVDLSQIAGYLSGKTILVTGGGGSIGSELCRQIARHTPKRLVLLDIYENNAYAIEQELHRTHPELDLAVCIGSVRDEMRVSSLFAQYRPDIVFHAAAHKHVPLMEGSPNEAIKNNVFGTLHVAQAADRYGTETFVLISTDKAVNPTNVMGASKRVCEMIVQTMAERSKTKFVAVRFGNVLGSNGSVIPLFRRQIEEGGPVTVTHPDIIRYFMTIPEAVSLVLQAGAYAGRGEIFVLDMGEPVRIDDLARNLIRLSGFEPDVDIEVRYTGLRPGEKLYEEMLMQEEGLRSTPNHLIHIGRPLDIDVPAFERQLTALAAACRENSPAIRTLLAQVVPTYHPEAGGRPAANVS